jgi:hypothetical protein
MTFDVVGAFALTLAFAGAMLLIRRWQYKGRNDRAGGARTGS